MQGSLPAQPLQPPEIRQSRMVLLHCHGNPGCSGPQEGVSDSSVFIPYPCFGVTTSNLQGRRGGSGEAHLA